MKRNDFEKAAVVGVAAGVGAAGVGIAAWLVIGLMQPVAIALAFMLIGLMDLGNHLPITWPIKLAIGLFSTGVFLTWCRGDKEDLRMQLALVGVMCIACIGLGMGLMLNGAAGDASRDIALTAREAENPVKDIRNIPQSLRSLITDGFPWFVLVAGLVSAIYGSVNYISGANREPGNAVTK